MCMVLRMCVVCLSVYTWHVVCGCCLGQCAMIYCTLNTLLTLYYTILYYAGLCVMLCMCVQQGDSIRIGKGMFDLGGVVPSVLLLISSYQVDDLRCPSSFLGSFSVAVGDG